MPVVVVEGDLAKARWAVGVDQVAGAQLATEHLIELGPPRRRPRRRPAGVDRGAGPHAGWQQAMYDAGLRPQQHLQGDWTAASGYEAGRELAASPR